MYTRDTHVAHAAPSTPSSGKPQLPKTSSQFAAALMMFAVTSVSMMGRTMPTACTYRRKTVNNNNGSRLHVTIRRYP